MANPYSLATSYVGETLLSGFNWFDGSDPNHGFVSYQCRELAKSMGLYSVDEHTGVVRLGVDSTNFYALNQGRPSIRLESKQSYNEGLFIADFLHMPPSKCGLWPAFWAYGNDWPNNGEIDIIEGANLNTKNLMSAHTRAGCSQPRIPATRSLARFTGQQRNAECSVGSDNTGCGYDPPAGDAASYGDGFNAAGGGVYAMQWDAESIKLWHFERGMIPPDVVEKRPNPVGWGLPQAVFGGEACDTRSYWRNMNLVLNINFCGDFGGGIWGNSECRNLASTCSEYVANNPSAFKDAYWDVRYIDVYQQNHAYAPPPPPYPTPSTHPNPPISLGFPTSPIPLWSSVPPVPPGAPVSGPGTSILLSTHRTSVPSAPAGMPTSVSRVTSFAKPSITVEVATQTVTVIPEKGIMRGTGSPHMATSSITSASKDGAGQFKANPTHFLDTRTATGTSTSTIPGYLDIHTMATQALASMTTIFTSRLTAPSSIPTSKVGSNQTAQSDSCKEYGVPATLSCFKSDASFPGFVLFHNGTSMTASECAAICVDANTSYAGLFKTDCYCSHYFDDPLMTSIGDDDCNHECPGDSTQRCGGALQGGLRALSIFDLKEDDDPSEHAKSPFPAMAPRLRHINAMLNQTLQRRRDCMAQTATAQTRTSSSQTKTKADFGIKGFGSMTAISIASRTSSHRAPSSSDTVRIKGGVSGPAVSWYDPLMEDFPDSLTTLLWQPTLVLPSSSTAPTETHTPNTNNNNNNDVPLDLPTQTPDSTPLDLPTHTTVAYVPASPNLAHSGASRENVDIWRTVGGLLSLFVLSIFI